MNHRLGASFTKLLEPNFVNDARAGAAFLREGDHFTGRRGMPSSGRVETIYVLPPIIVAQGIYLWLAHRRS